MAVNAADAWQQSGSRADRPYRPAPRDRAMASERPARPRGSVPPRRSADRAAERPRERSRADYYDEAPQYSRPPVPRRPETSRPVPRDHDRAAERERPARRPVERRPVERPDTERPARRPAPAVETGGGKLRGLLAVLAVFLVTLAAAGVESFIATGLGIMTTIALAASTAVAALVVRRRDLLSVLVCPPIVFSAVAVVNMVAAPSVHISGVKAFGLLMITMLVQNFPAMGIATGIALVIGLVRLAARR
ncbi:DUF6542 domain-containing protein [Petropleomorpha daqingensis]|uniref:DUF6542 domain-containing protein n=1 Tax=Petropleomorpha daqingensis TaxID=2026353 RepID=A0A853CET2_9ACTN|nr:DUF6542 domain-containing protein [Petropleomorpha daqingensis]NYJ06374.1 hypothetical protein [Petropleomorpha daqingensis]